MGFCILSLDGGGVRGVYTAVLLQRLSEAVPGWLDRVDLFAGTSTGGILALGLARGLSPAQLVALYRDNARVIFDDSWWDDLRDLGRLAGAEFDNVALKKVLERELGPGTLGDLPRRVLIPAFDLDPGPEAHPRCWRPKFLHNYPGPGSDEGVPIVDAALRTSAAPTYFPSYQGFVDGGVAANNPAMCALAQALDADTGNQRVGDVRLLSLGTGVRAQFIEGDRHDWGFGQWARPLVELMIEGSMGVADYQCRRLLGDAQYLRVAPLLPQAIGLADADRVDALIAYAEAVALEPAITWLTRAFGADA